MEKPEITNTMVKALLLLNEIENTTGTGSQAKIKKMILDNYTEELGYILWVAFNPFVKTHLNKLSDTTDIYSLGDIESYNEDFNYFKKLIHELRMVKACTNALRDLVTEWVNSFDGDCKRILTMIMTKNMNIGIGAKLINDALKKHLGKDLIPDPSAMLADKGIEKIEKWDTKKLRANIKYDGVRVIAKWDETNGWSYFTRNFNEFDPTKMTTISENLDILCKTLIDNATKYKTGFFVDGELIAKDSIVEGVNSSGARQSITGDVNKILKGKAPDGIDKGFDYVLFDVENTNILDGEKGTKTYSHRRDLLVEMFDIETPLSNVSLAVEWEVENTEEGMNKIREIYDELIAKGEEGLIIKHPDSVYECKRGKYWIKMKEILSADLEVIETIEGTGTMVGTLGAIRVKFSSGETVKVGSGFTEKERAEIWEDTSKIIGKIVEVEYNAKSTDKNGSKSLFLPIFKGVRVDKTEAEVY